MPRAVNVYRGKVDITFKRNNINLKKVTHNTGLSDMALVFAKAITGNTNPANDLPRLLDIGYEPTTTTEQSWNSILNNPVNIGGRQYKFDSDLDNWVGILTSTVYASDLNGAILNDVLQNVSEGTYTLKARLCSYNVKERKYLAEIELDIVDIKSIKEKTSAIFDWYLELLYDVEDTESVETSINRNN